MANTKLLESILNGDYVSANELFEERMVELQEQKLYETKQMVASEMNEVFLSKHTREKLKQGYRFISPEERANLSINPKGQKDKVKRDPSAIAPEKSTKKVGVIRRNWNTFRGREPDYVKSKEPSKGGTVGKYARKAGQFVAGVLSNV